MLLRALAPPLMVMVVLVLVLVLVVACAPPQGAPLTESQILLLQALALPMVAVVIGVPVAVIVAVCAPPPLVGRKHHVARCVLGDAWMVRVHDAQQPN